jgi:rubredoxin
VWFLFHHNHKTRVVPGGKSFIETCPECRRRARFDEVEVSENFGMFFVDLIGEKERKYRCSGCANVFDLRDEADAPAAPRPAPTPAKSARELEREQAAEQARRQAAEQARQLAAEQRRRAAEQQRRELAEAKANRIEDELAELKKRLGR